MSYSTNLTSLTSSIRRPDVNSPSAWIWHEENFWAVLYIAILIAMIAEIFV